MQQLELNHRANEVFDLEENEEVRDVYVDEKGIVHVWIITEDSECDYMPAMEDRPQALEYLLGLRDEFDD